MNKYQGSGQSAVLSNPALTGLSGAATTYSFSAFDASFRGIVITVAADAGVESPDTDAVTGAAFLPLAASEGCIFLWLIADDGATVGVAQSKIVKLDAQGNFQWDAPNFPPIPTVVVSGVEREYIPFAYAVVKNSSSGTSWVFGTGLWNQAGISISVKNVMEVPDRPRQS
jgi:hypothetical protein